MTDTQNLSKSTPLEARKLAAEIIDDVRQDADWSVHVHIRNLITSERRRAAKQRGQTSNGSSQVA